MFPTLYPIALVLSRISPYSDKVSFNNNNVLQKLELIESKEEQETLTQAIDKFKFSEIKRLLPLLIESANHKNYLGRLMLSKALLPFV